MYCTYIRYVCSCYAGDSSPAREMYAVVCMINLWEEKLSAEEHIEIVPPGFDPLSTRVSGTYCTSRGEKQHYADGNRVGIR